MNDQLSMFEPMTCADTPSAISSQASESGPMPCALPDGPTTAKSGPAPAPASHSARQAKAKRSTTKGIFGQSGFLSSKHDDLSFALASRYQALTDSLGSMLFELTWMTRITPMGFSIPAQRASEPRTEDSVCIGWPSPQAHDVTTRGNTMADGHYFPHDLSNAALMASWPTTQERDWKGPQGRSYKGTAVDLPAAAAAAWPTPRAEDAESSGMRHGRGVADTMMAVAALAGWPTPVANDDNKTPEAHLAMKARMGERDGSGANRTAITSLQVMAQLTAWKTPCVPNGGRIRGNATDIGKHQDGTKAQIGLENEAKLSGWVTPLTGDSHPNLMHRERPDGGQPNLAYEAQLTAFGDKPIGYLLGPNGWEIVPACGQLSAAHSAFLMGLPPEWDLAAIRALKKLKKSKRKG